MKKCILILIYTIISFSIYGQAISTEVAKDWNKVWQSGFYQSMDGNSLNSPPYTTSLKWYWGINVAHTSNNPDYRYNGQILFGVNANPTWSPQVYVRSTNHAGEGIWAKVIHSKGNHTIEGQLNTNRIQTNYMYIGRQLDDKDPSLHWAGNLSRLEYAGHNLVVGSTKGIYAHNTMHLKPGGSSYGEIYSALEIYRTINEETHIRAIRFSAERNRDNFINNGGKLGIGTDNPQSTLDVRGKIIANEVEVKINTGADFVFKPDYQLKPLSEVETFVKENQHLPDIPSEKEMQENGLNLNDMQIKLLQKIEELTLYVIDLKKENEEIKGELINLKNK